jgi:hypothetical protein
MQADEIIQQKEWHELNTEERSIVKELADTESEYNLLKKMLQVSAEEATQVPGLSDRVKYELYAEIPAKKNNRRTYWYAAAAAIILIMLATVFIRQKNNIQEPIVKNDTTIKRSSPAMVKKDIVPAADSIIKIPVYKEPLQKATVQIKKTTPKKTTIEPIDPLQQNEPVYAVVTKSVAEEKGLLDLVTEMY